MHSGWPNNNLNKLESLIRSKRSFTDKEIPDGWFDQTSAQVIALSDEYAIELTRICLVNLAIRHSGGDLNNFTVSSEGVEHSVYRVLDLLKESVPSGD